MVDNRYNKFQLLNGQWTIQKEFSKGSYMKNQSCKATQPSITFSDRSLCRFILYYPSPLHQFILPHFLCRKEWTRPSHQKTNLKREILSQFLFDNKALHQKTNLKANGCSKIRENLGFFNHELVYGTSAKYA